MTQIGRRSFLRFIAVGVLNTGVGVATIAIASLVFNAGPYFANVLGFTVGILVGYQFNRRWTYGSSSSVLISAPRYLLVFAMSFAVNLGVLAALLQWLDMLPILAQPVAISAYSVVFYLLCRFVVFPDTK